MRKKKIKQHKFMKLNDFMKVTINSIQILEMPSNLPDSPSLPQYNQLCAHEFEQKLLKATAKTAIVKHLRFQRISSVNFSSGYWKTKRKIKPKDPE